MSQLTKPLICFFVTLLLAGCQVMTGDESISEYSQDTKVTTEIKTKLMRSDEVPGNKVHVETDQGVVQLSGFVNNVEQKTRAEQIAKSVNGVKSVRNNIVAKHYRLNK